MRWALALIALWASPSGAQRVERVPEAAMDVVVLALDPIPLAGPLGPGAVPWAEDRRLDALDPFARAAWYLELTSPAGAQQWVYISAPAFALGPADHGVPLQGVLQRPLRDLEVRSNVPGVPVGDGLDGNLEFWPSNYVPLNAAGVEGAGDDVYDAGDLPVAPARGYGSMQVHVEGVPALSYNAWGSPGVPDLGIGPNAVPAQDGAVHTDWTFRGNAAEHLGRRLEVLVRPGPPPPGLSIEVTRPSPHEVAQQEDDGTAEVEVRGRLHAAFDRLEVRWGAGGWEVLDARPVGGLFAGAVRLPAGWAELQVRGLRAGEVVDEVTVGPLGVGEVFITAGQSNAANAGLPPQVPRDPRVSAAAVTGWQHAADPQPIANGAGGSPWPALGDALVAAWDVPVGFVSVAIGGTAVSQWRPGAPDALFERLVDASDRLGHRGFRAVLWHQGESDALGATASEDYARMLEEIVAASRRAAGWPAPWGVARAAFVPDLDPAFAAAVVAGQGIVIERDALVFEGPATDDLVGPEWRHDGIHFNGPGLAEHGERWAAAVLAALPCAGRPEACLPEPPDAGAPDAGGLDAGAPDSGEPDVGAPDVQVPDSGDPDVVARDEQAPDAEPPDVRGPDMRTPDVRGPDMEPPDVESSDGPVPDVESSDGPVPDVESPDVPFPDMAAPDVRLADVEPPDGASPDGPAPDAGRADTGPEATDEPAAGDGCQVGPGRTRWAFLWALVPVALRRRRRR